MQRLRSTAILQVIIELLPFPVFGILLLRSISLKTLDVMKCNKMKHIDSGQLEGVQSTRTITLSLFIFIQLSAYSEHFS